MEKTKVVWPTDMRGVCYALGQKVIKPEITKENALVLGFRIVSSIIDKKVYVKSIKNETKREYILQNPERCLIWPI